jgi:hypothetical protein
VFTGAVARRDTQTATEISSAATNTRSTSSTCDQTVDQPATKRSVQYSFLFLFFFFFFCESILHSYKIYRFLFLSFSFCHCISRLTKWCALLVIDNDSLRVGVEEGMNHPSPC